MKKLKTFAETEEEEKRPIPEGPDFDENEQNDDDLPENDLLIPAEEFWLKYLD